MRYFKTGRRYDEYRLIKANQYKNHVEIVLESYDETYFTDRAKSAEKTATMIAKSFGIVELVKKSEVRFIQTNKMVTVIDDDGYVHEEIERFAYQVFYFNRRHRPKKKKFQK